MLDISLVISIAAFLLSIVTIYFQWFRVKGPKIDLLNLNDMQEIDVHIPPPPKEKHEYYSISPERKGNAVIKLVFGNAGDRAGIAMIKDMTITNKQNVVTNIETSFDRYTVIPALEIVEKDIALRNIQIISVVALKFDLALSIETGGYHPRTGVYIKNINIQKVIHLKFLYPS